MYPTKSSTTFSSRRHLDLGTLLLGTMLLGMVLSAGAATAGELAEVGMIHPDGRVSLDLDRFAPTIQNGTAEAVPVDKTLFKVSNGFLYIVRLGADGCTTETLVTTGGYEVPESFPIVRTSTPDGLYEVGSSTPLVEPTGVFTKLAVISISLFVTCENVDCDGGLCSRNEWGNSVDCDCVYVWINEDGFLEHDRGNPGCEKRLVFPHWWGLASSVLPAHIETY